MWATNSETEFVCLLVLPFFIVSLILIGRYLIFIRQDAPIALERWTKEAGYRIVRQERRILFTGPFFWNSSDYQIIYRINVQDPSGSAKSGWLRIGSYWWPLAAGVDVRWDDPTPPSTEPVTPLPRLIVDDVG